MSPTCSERAHMLDARLQGDTTRRLERAGWRRGYISNRRRRLRAQSLDSGIHPHLGENPGPTVSAEQRLIAYYIDEPG